MRSTLLLNTINGPAVAPKPCYHASAIETLFFNDLSSEVDPRSYRSRIETVLGGYSILRTPIYSILLLSASLVHAHLGGCLAQV